MQSLKNQMKAKKAKKAALREPITPKAPYAKPVQLVLDRLPTKTPPILLRYTDAGAGYVGSACHLNVKHHLLSNPGVRVHGWVVWQYPNFAQAEFHSVWADAAGTLFNITPHRNGQTEILFVRDDELRITVDGETGRDVLYCAITSAPFPYYAAGSQMTESPLYTMQVPAGSELDQAMLRFGMLHLR